MDAAKLLSGNRIVPVVVIEELETAVPLAETLSQVGFGAIEVTLRTPVALQAIGEIRRQVPNILCGAGSIRQPQQIEAVLSVDAQFCVSPGSTGALLQAAVDVPLVPGAETATEMMRLMEMGYTLQKLFPAELMGGLKRISALSAPLPEVRFFPTGGINASLVTDYLSHPSVNCVGGSWFVSNQDLADRNFNNIGDSAAAALALLSCEEVSGEEVSGEGTP